MNFKEVKIETLIKELQKLKDKGEEVVLLHGTLMCDEKTNYIIDSTEDQY